MKQLPFRSTGAMLHDLLILGALVLKPYFHLQQTEEKKMNITILATRMQATFFAIYQTAFKTSEVYFYDTLFYDDIDTLKNLPDSLNGLC